MTAPSELLGPPDVPALRALLTRDASHNLMLLGLLEDFGVAPREGMAPFHFYGHRVGSGLSAALFVGGAGGLVIPAASALTDLVPLLQPLAGSVHATTVLGERAAVDLVVKQLGPRSPRLNRAQRMMTVSADDLGPFTNPRLRLAREEDLSRLLPLAAEAVESLYGYRPLEHGATAFREQVQRRIRAQRTYVLELEGKLVFKVDVGARSEQGAELETLYTATAHRRSGHATLSLGQICRHLLSSLPRLSLRIDEDHAALGDIARKVGFVPGRAQRLVVAQ